MPANTELLPWVTEHIPREQKTFWQKVKASLQKVKKNFVPDSFEITKLKTVVLEKLRTKEIVKTYQGEMQRVGETYFTNWKLTLSKKYPNKLPEEIEQLAQAAANESLASFLKDIVKVYLAELYPSETTLQQRAKKKWVER